MRGVDPRAVERAAKSDSLKILAHDVKTDRYADSVRQTEQFFERGHPPNWSALRLPRLRRELRRLVATAPLESAVC